MKSCLFNCSFFVAVVATLAVSLNTGMSQTEPTKGSRDTIYVGKILVQKSVEESAKKAGDSLELQRLRDSLDSQLTSAIAATRVFTIVDRRRMPDLEDESKMRDFLTGGVSALDAKTAKYALMLEIDGFQDLVETKQFSQVGRVDMTHTMSASVVLQIVDMATREVLPDIPSVQLSKDENKKMVTAEAAVPSDAIAVELAKDLAAAVTQQAISLLCPAKVLAVTGKQVMINRGTQSGFEKDKKVEFYAIESIVDPDSGETFANELPVGSGVIVRGDNKKSFAMIQEDLGIASGCVVKVVE